MNDKKLISLVRSNSFLYDKHSPSFKNVEMKQNTWEAISQELHTPVDVCMRRWTALRERYSREARRCVPTDSEKSQTDSWHLYSEMEFLKSHVKPRKTRYSTNYSTSADHPSDFQVKSELEELTDFAIPSSPAPQEESFQMGSSVMFEETAFPMEFAQLSSQDIKNQMPPSTTPSPHLSESSESFCSKKRKESLTDIVFLDAVTCFKKMCEWEMKTKNEDTEAEALGRLVTATVSKMSEKKQSKAIKEVTSILMAIKDEQELETQKSNLCCKCNEKYVLLQ